LKKVTFELKYNYYSVDVLGNTHQLVFIAKIDFPASYRQLEMTMCN